jgi:hypothetical protein
MKNENVFSYGLKMLEFNLSNAGPTIYEVMENVMA